MRTGRGLCFVVEALIELIRVSSRVTVLSHDPEYTREVFFCAGPPPPLGRTFFSGTDAMMMPGGESVSTFAVSKIEQR